MSKYITHFQTEAAYQAALPSLDLPNVSLVDELGEVHYHRALYGAHAGDIALYDVAEGQKIVVTAANWNLTDYPTASYPIIGIIIDDETPNGVFAMHTLLPTKDGTGTTTTDNYIGWVTNTFDWGLTKISNSSAAEADVYGQTNTATILAAIKAYDLSQGTDNITGHIGETLEHFAPTGTVAGDWFVPSSGQYKIIYDNKTILGATADKIRNANSSLSLTGQNLFYPYNTIFLTSSEGSSSYYLCAFNNGNFEFSKSKNSTEKVRFITKL